MDLQSLWFAAVAVLWTGFLLLEGFDFGVAALIPVLGRGTPDRHLMLRSIGPLWDGNEVWLITAAGAVFAAFPGWYATWLPALYLPFVLVLFGLIIRAVAFEWRHSHSTEGWDATWTRVITTGSLIAALGIGAALGATTLGLPIDADGNRVGGPLAGVGWPAVLGITPASRRIFNRFRSLWICCDGSLPNNFANRAPTAPPGGSYWSSTRTSVPRPPAASRKVTDPAFGTSDPSSERHPISAFSSS